MKIKIIKPFKDLQGYILNADRVSPAMYCTAHGYIPARFCEVLSKPSLVDVEKIILKQPAIRLEKTLRKRKETLEEFLVKFFTDYNLSKNTIFVDSKKVQTDIGRRRSIGDIFRIVKYYYPESTLKEVANLLYFILPSKLPSFRSSMCKTINKRVFYYNLSLGSGFFNKSFKDEYSLNYKDWEERINE